MREIKFRAWDKEGRRMFEVDGLSFLNQYITDEAGQHSFKFNQCYLMQFTGLKDKNGKEIYEGDIVKGEYSNNGQVEFGKGLIDASDYEAYALSIQGFYINNGKLDIAEKSAWPVNVPASLIECHELIEVIGNIYENPELLKERNSV